MRKFAENWRSAILPGSFLLLVLLAGCANSVDVTHCLSGHTYGFWGGLCTGLLPRSI